MDHLVDTYAQILVDVGTTDADFARVRDVLIARGHGRLWKRVLREAERRIKRIAVRAQPTLVVARAELATAPTPALMRAQEELAAGESPRVVVDPHITGGFILKKGFIRLDRSYKTALIKLYQRVTAH